MDDESEDREIIERDLVAEVDPGVEGLVGAGGDGEKVVIGGGTLIDADRGVDGARRSGNDGDVVTLIGAN